MGEEGIWAGSQASRRSRDNCHLYLSEVGGNKGVLVTAVGSQSEFPLPMELALPGNLLEMQISGPYARPPELNTPELALSVLINPSNGSDACLRLDTTGSD